ncbi:MAG: sigma 54-interacting transcriptional regulator [Clostridia bacterium]|nr:sigma 54-interacting transcriptional regulator [Clostridia bacterium]MCI1959711.1 sigma 54-interacting transcriptional regulator [Clostridia bacterium]MCI1999187.1 sigma 54-interacting transcriptional regulator [Clostridia bacterium]MCI2014860.1 sigma 54-interacting transcriptional regulator [Clostridia bacterium]
MKKRKRICFLAFSQGYAGHISKLCIENGINADVRSCDEDSMFFVCRDMLNEGTKLFIAAGADLRNIYGGNADYLMNIRHHTVDYMRTEIKNEKYVCVLHRDCEYIDCELLSRKWNCKTEDVVMHRTEVEKDRFFFKAYTEKILCVGPFEYEEHARRMGVRYKTINPSLETVVDAFEKAKSILDMQDLEERRNRENVLRLEQYKVVFNFTNDAILAIDENGKIIAANDMVYKFLRWDQNDRLEGKHITNVVKGTKMIKVMEKDEGDIGDVFELPNMTVLTHRIPIVINGQKRGVVSTFQDLAVLQEHEKNARLNIKRKKGFSAKYTFDDIKGSSQAITEVKNVAKSYANSDSTVLILGETGTGKELFAQSIHNSGPRAGGPFVAVNCAAIPKNLLEAEFFGYEEGSFTGASKGGKMGMFEMAHMGTIFLDEIGEMPLEMQVQILRVIQEKEIRRIGSDRVIPVDVRVISATNRDLKNEVEKGNFRNDLYYRLDVLELKIPPLRDRKEDIPEIAINCLKNLDYKSYKANEALWWSIIEELEKHEMKGNIRELQNMIERLNVMLKNSHINTTALFSEISRSIGDDSEEIRHTGLYEDDESPDLSDKGWEKKRIIKALKMNGLSRTKTAEYLGISRSTLWNKMKYYDIKL